MAIEATQAKPSRIRSSGGGEFDCYLVVPKTDAPVPAMVLASAIHGVDADMRAIADEFAADGYLSPRPICSGARCRDRCHATTIAPSARPAAP